MRTTSWPRPQAAGAAAALAERGLAEAGLPGIEVADRAGALGQIAAAWRRRFELPLIAVTGSNGKTTVTQMIAAILRAWQRRGRLRHRGQPEQRHRPAADAAAPAAPTHRAAVVELGMNHPGEIARLAAIAQPTVALVNNAQREHQEFMASVEAVARENGAVIEALAADGVAVFPADDEYAPIWRAAGRRAPQHDLRLAARADVTRRARPGQATAGRARCSTPAGGATFALHAAGLHNVRNALAAIACALAAGCR